MDSRSLGVLMVAGGIVLVLLGLLVAWGGLGWFGRLPGDFRFEGEHTRVYFPLASGLLVSVLLSLVLYLLRRFL